MSILITGGQSQIGWAIAERRLKMGDEVFVTSSSEKGLEILKEKTLPYGSKAKVLSFDLMKPEAFEENLNSLLIQGQGLQSLVLNACTPLPSGMRSFHKISLQEADNFFKANVFGNMWLMQKILPHFMKNKFGRILFISSGTTDHALPGYSIYAAVKLAVEAYIRNIALEYGHFNISANILRLGIIQTERNKRFWSRPTYIEKAVKKISLNKLGQPEHVAFATDPFLNYESYIQGSILNVDGGIINTDS